MDFNQRQAQPPVNPVWPVTRMRLPDRARSKVSREEFFIRVRSMTDADFGSGYSNRGAVARHPGLGSCAIPAHIPVESAAKFSVSFLSDEKKAGYPAFFAAA